MPRRGGVAASLAAIANVDATVDEMDATTEIGESDEVEGIYRANQIEEIVQREMTHIEAVDRCDRRRRCCDRLFLSLLSSVIVGIVSYLVVLLVLNMIY